ncbi:MAG: hypothetical protein FMNOHCHN_03606 [Ignavibacteriaceae bacterium]|nr:hypothetical protein [Ignavibacteriaceae bacterium]GIL17940.1 MAG: hypothetical protein BroJett040_16910 [Oligoflexia bacterium]
MERIQLVRKKIYDPFLRMIHLILGLSTLILILSGILGAWLEQGEETALLWDIHMTVGYIFALAILTRILWAFLGPTFARWHELFHFQVWKEVLITKKRPHLSSFGHDPMASLAYLGFYFLSLLMVVTGFLVAGIEHGEGPLADWLFDSIWLTNIYETPHLIGAYLIGGFILIHIGALIYHEKKERLPLTQAMISGYQYRHQQQEEKSETP